MFVFFFQSLSSLTMKLVFGSILSLFYNHRQLFILFLFIYLLLIIFSFILFICYSLSFFKMINDEKNQVSRIGIKTKPETETETSTKGFGPGSNYLGTDMTNSNFFSIILKTISSVQSFLSNWLRCQFSLVRFIFVQI